jgi:hypothetical protein
MTLCVEAIKGRTKIQIIKVAETGDKFITIIIDTSAKNSDPLAINNRYIGHASDKFVNGALHWSKVSI